MGKTKKGAKNRNKKKGSASTPITGYESLDFSSGDELAGRTTANTSKKEEKVSFDHISVFNSPMLSVKTMLRVIAGAL